MDPNEGQRLHGHLANALRKSLEEMAFAEVIQLTGNLAPEIEEMEVRPRTAVLWAKVPLVEPLKGDLMVQVAPELAETLTEMMYGVLDDSGMGDEAVMDALAEMTNVIAGRFLDAILDGALFELGLPDRGKASSDKEVPALATPNISTDFAVEGHRMTLTASGSDLFKK